MKCTRLPIEQSCADSNTSWQKVGKRRGFGSIREDPKYRSTGSEKKAEIKRWTEVGFADRGLSVFRDVLML